MVQISALLESKYKIHITLQQKHILHGLSSHSLQLDVIAFCKQPISATCMVWEHIQHKTHLIITVRTSFTFMECRILMEFNWQPIMSNLIISFSWQLLNKSCNHISNTYETVKLKVVIVKCILYKYLCHGKLYSFSMMIA